MNDEKVNDKKVEEVLGATGIKPGEKVDNIAQEVPKTEEAKKVINDDYQVILDNRGLYKIADKWWVKVRRINVQEMIKGWGIIQHTFGNVTTMGADLKDYRTWIIMFASATTVVPGKFYMFLAQIMELQYDEGMPQKELRKLRDEYNGYLRKDLKTEELLDVLGVIYKQEEDRIDELVKKAQSLFAPLMEMMKKKAEKEKMEAVKKATEILKK